MAVQREQILSLEQYEQRRPMLRQRILFEKKRRRVHLGEHFTFLFENEETLRYQIHEMLRIEKREGEEAIAHELATYNEVLGGAGGLGCTLLIEVDDVALRDELLRSWLALPQHIYLELEDAERVRPSYDERQVGDTRLSAVQYFKFDCGGRPPRALGCDLPGLELHHELTAEQRGALLEDLAES